jgi:hypothetical protein
MTCRLPPNIKEYKPNFKGVQTLTLKVADTKHSYTITIGERMPMFTFNPQSLEIFHRLILRAVLATGLEEFKL